MKDSLREGERKGGAITFPSDSVGDSHNIMLLKRSRVQNYIYSFGFVSVDVRTRRLGN